MGGLLVELRRRHVIRVGGFYAVAAWLLVQVAATLEGALNLPEWFDTMVTSGLLIGFPIALLLAWASMKWTTNLMYTTLSMWPSATALVA